MSSIKCSLVKMQAISAKTGNPYTYASLQTEDGTEIQKVFFKPLEYKALGL